MMNERHAKPRFPTRCANAALVALLGLAAPGCAIENDETEAVALSEGALERSRVVDEGELAWNASRRVSTQAKRYSAVRFQARAGARALVQVSGRHPRSSPNVTLYDASLEHQVAPIDASRRENSVALRFDLERDAPMVLLIEEWTGLISETMDVALVDVAAQPWRALLPEQPQTFGASADLPCVTRSLDGPGATWRTSRSEQSHSVRLEVRGPLIEAASSPPQGHGGGTVWSVLSAVTGAWRAGGSESHPNGVSATWSRSGALRVRDDGTLAARVVVESHRRSGKGAVRTTICQGEVAVQ